MESPLFKTLKTLLSKVPATAIDPAFRLSKTLLIKRKASQKVYVDWKGFLPCLAEALADPKEGEEVRKVLPYLTMTSYVDVTELEGPVTVWAQLETVVIVEPFSLADRVPTVEEYRAMRENEALQSETRERMAREYADRTLRYENRTCVTISSLCVEPDCSE